MTWTQVTSRKSYHCDENSHTQLHIAHHCDEHPYHTHNYIYKQRMTHNNKQTTSHHTVTYSTKRISPITAANFGAPGQVLRK